MNGRTKKHLSRVVTKFHDAGHHVSLRKLKMRWLETPWDERNRMLDDMMKQAGIYWVAGERGATRKDKRYGA